MAWLLIKLCGGIYFRLISWQLGTSALEWHATATRRPRGVFIIRWVPELPATDQSPSVAMGNNRIGMEERMRAENARLVEELAETRENLEEEERSVSIYFAETQAAKAALVAMEKAKNEYATLAHERGKEVERLRAALQRLDPALGTS